MNSDTPRVLKVARLHPDAHPPKRADSGAAGYDLYARGDQCGRLIATGVAVEIPAGWVGIVKDRSSVALSGRAFTVVGVMDGSYRGEVRVVFDREVTVTDGERIAQLVVVPHFDGVVVTDRPLSATARDTGGFGSTGRGIHDMPDPVPAGEPTS